MNDDQILGESYINIEKLNDAYTKVTLADVHAVYKKWFEVEDTNRLDIVLATALSQKMKGTPIWLIMVSRSGDMKSEQLNALDDSGETAKIVHRFTDKTLVNGFKDKVEYPDLAPKLDGKIMLILDMAEILQLHPNIKNQVWAQFRDLYDGYAGVQSGMGTDIQYKNLRVTFIGASTPAIDEQILIHQSLGTRELIYRPKQEVDVNKIMEKVWFNEKYEAVMHNEIKLTVQKFLRGIKNIQQIEISTEVMKKIMAMSRYLAYMRAAAPIDSYSGELRGFIHPEQPTRVLKQLKRIFICLKNLDPNYTDEKALQIIKEVVDSSVDMIRTKILNTLFQKNAIMTTGDLIEALKLSKKTVRGELIVLWNIGLINRRAVETTNSYGIPYLIQEEWEINKKNEFINDVYNIYVAEVSIIPRYPITDLEFKESLRSNLGMQTTSAEYKSEEKELARCDICKELRVLVGVRELFDEFLHRPVIFQCCATCMSVPMDEGEND